jgi:hypothetical protein
MSASDFSDLVRTGTKNRADGKCEWCGAAATNPDLHHRLFRSRGGTGDGSNAVALCRHCHSRAHGIMPGDWEAAEEAGISLRAFVDPRTVPIHSRTFGLPMWILANGDFVFAEPTLE